MAYEKGKSVNELVKENEGLVFKQLKRFGLYNDNDAISLGYEALFIAITTFDETKNNAFSTYATVCIYNKLGSYVRMLKSKPELVSYEVASDTNGLLGVEHGAAADSKYMDTANVKHLYQHVYEQFHTTMSPLQRLILDIWIDSQFEMSLTNIAKQVNCSDAYVSKVVKIFRQGLKQRLQIRR